MIAVAAVDRDVVVIACAISAGVHAALAPGHFAEGIPQGLGFAASAVLLAGLGVTMTRRPASATAVAVSGAGLGGLLVSYALATTTGLPLLHPQVEPVDGLALVTKAIEAVGLFAAVHVFLRERPALTLSHRLPKGRLT